MSKITHIIVPVDFLQTTDNLVEYAAYMAEKLQAVLHFVYVVDMYTGDGILEVPYVEECRKRLQTAAEGKMTRLIADNIVKFPGCTGEILLGDPVEKIVDYARDKSGDLIVISSHGAKGLEKILLGSVTKRVLKRAHCPVLITNPYRK